MAPIRGLALALCGLSLDAQVDPQLAAAFAAARPPQAEALWTLIPWRHSLTDALDEGRRQRKPIYLFVNDGDVESGRC